MRINTRLFEQLDAVKDYLLEDQVIDIDSLHRILSRMSKLRGLTIGLSRKSELIRVGPIDSRRTAERLDDYIYGSLSIKGVTTGIQELDDGWYVVVDGTGGI